MRLLNVWFIYASYNFCCGYMLSCIFHRSFLTGCLTFLYVSGFRDSAGLVKWYTNKHMNKENHVCVMNRAHLVMLVMLSNVRHVTIAVLLPRIVAPTNPQIPFPVYILFVLLFLLSMQQSITLPSPCFVFCT